MKAVLHFRASAALKQRMTAQAPTWLEVAFADDTDEEAMRNALREADVLLHVLAPATAELMTAAPRLRLVQKVGVGLNTIDLNAAAKRGIRVANMPGTNSRAVSEATLALMLAVLRRVAPLDAATRAGRGWCLPADATDDIGEICGRTVGLVGFGAVPRLLAPVLEALGARVQFWSRSLVSKAPVPQVDWDSLLRTSDILSLHVPLADDTHYLIEEKALARMPKGAILINTARGPLVKEVALCLALREGQLRGAGIDVFEQEPAAADNPLLALPQVVVAPHLAWCTTETIERSMAVIFENCARLRDGRPLMHEVALPPAPR